MGNIEKGPGEGENGAKALIFTHNNHPWPLKFVLRIELHPLFLLILRVPQDILQGVFSCFEMLVVKGFGYFGFR